MKLNPGYCLAGTEQLLVMKQFVYFKQKLMRALRVPCLFVMKKYRQFQGVLKIDIQTAVRCVVMKACSHDAR